MRRNLFIILFAAVGLTRAEGHDVPFVIPDSLRAVIADSLKRAIFDLYPLELTDTARIESAFAEFAAAEPCREVFQVIPAIELAKVFEGSLFYALVKSLCDPMARVLLTDSISEPPFQPATVEAESLHYGYERIVLKGQIDTDAAAKLLDSTLQIYRERDALILDLRWSTAEQLDGLFPLAAPLISRELKGIGIKKRVAGTTMYETRTPPLVPADSAFSKPVGILLNYDWDHTGYFFFRLEEKRPHTLVALAGAKFCSVKGIAPESVGLPYNLIAQIPTTQYLNWDGTVFTLGDLTLCDGCYEITSMPVLYAPRIHKDDSVNNMIYELRKACEEYAQDN